MRNPVIAAIGLAVLAAACASPSPDATEPGPRAEPGASAPATEAPPARPEAATRGSTEAEPAEDAAPPAEPEPPRLGRDHRTAVACTTDADCGWNDDCFPTRCVEAHPPQACDESAPEPGTCACFEGACTLKPHTPPPPAGTCEPRACVVDRAAGKCVADDGGVAEDVRYSEPVEVGPSCDCLRPDAGCVFSWFEPVPCESDRDCWIDHLPRRHPVARPKALRKRDFEPCSDGEVAPKCGPEKRCVLGPAYKC